MEKDGPRESIRVCSFTLLCQGEDLNQESYLEYCRMGDMFLLHQHLPDVMSWLTRLEGFYFLVLCGVRQSTDVLHPL